MIPEFEAILDEAEKKMGDEDSREKLFFEVYFFIEQFEKDGRDITLQQAIFYAEQFEATQNMKKAYADIPITTIGTMDSTLSRAERRAMERKSSNKSATKKHKKYKKK